MNAEYEATVRYYERYWSMSDYPELNVPLLQDLIAWAEFDSTPMQEERLRRWIDEHRLGLWDQSVWGAADVGGRPELLHREVYDDGEVDLEVDSQAVNDAVASGVCRTAHCQAGGAVMASGYALVYNDNVTDRYFPIAHEEKVEREAVVTADNCIKGQWVGKGMDKRFVPDEGAVSRSIDIVAQEVLGLVEWEADLYFEPDNTIGDLKSMVNAMCERRGLIAVYDLVDA